MQSVLYIHGFNSSPLSVKAQQTKKYLQSHYKHVEFFCPQVASSPKAALKQLEDILTSKPNHQWCLMGSSLGGYFSTYLAEKYQLKAVLINPAVKPYELLTDYLGEQVNPYTNEVYQVTNSFIDDLKLLDKEKISKKHYLLMVQTGDEVLDYQQAVDKYNNCQMIIEQGGDHSFVQFEEKLPEIATFLSL